MTRKMTRLLTGSGELHAHLYCTFNYVSFFFFPIFARSFSFFFFPLFFFFLSFLSPFLYRNPHSTPFPRSDSSNRCFLQTIVGVPQTQILARNLRAIIGVLRQLQTTLIRSQWELETMQRRTRTRGGFRQKCKQLQMGLAWGDGCPAGAHHL